ncbi:hypothetical protein KY346_05280 [Candidatus Woesearchaeota archaeon]|nr:hypothetical protein [Candidatus Woesearchaeota archaeon]
MKAINLIAIISLLLLVIACVPPAEELAGINKTKEKKPIVEVKQEITVIPDLPENKTEENITATPSEKKINATNATQKANMTAPPITGVPTIVYTGGAIEMGEGEKANIIVK